MTNYGSMLAVYHRHANGATRIPEYPDLEEGDSTTSWGG